MSEPPTVRSGLDRAAFDYYDNKRDDALNLGLGEIDGLYHHHFAVGDFDRSILALPEPERGQAVNRELHRMETDQVTDLILSAMGQVDRGDRVLDAGSGRGGTAFLLNRHYGCQVDGVNLSSYQTAFCREQARRHGVEDQVAFHERNMGRTGFEGSTFTHIVTNETTMYVDLPTVFAEFARLLVPGGTYLLVTWCRNDAVAPASAEAQAIDTHYHCHTHRRSTYLRALVHAGLIPHQVDDLTQNAIPHWELRSVSPLASGIERAYLNGYRSNKISYLRIAARKSLNFPPSGPALPKPAAAVSSRPWGGVPGPDTRQFSIPPRQAISTTAVSPYGEQISRASITWLQRHNVLDREDQLNRLHQARLGLLTDRCHPHTRPEVLQAIADWHLWLFALDDSYCDESDFGAHPAAMSQMAARLLHIVDAPHDDIPPGAGRCASALRDIRRRLDAHASPLQVHRWTAAVHDYLFGIVWEAANRAEGTVPTLGEYLPMRRLIGAIDSAICLIDVSTGNEVSAHDWASPGLQALTRHAANLTCWDNDLVSYHKERSDHGAMHNLVTVLAREHACTLQEAVHRTVAMREEEARALLTTESRLRPTLDEAARTYIDGLKHWVQGHLDYSTESSRWHPTGA
ncbi:methyltransferase domain-containing protein [Streptomyces roseoverticillatus]|uniref:terpene synthase family protein n=1 Tax=Streptomyces roseoverticillatus TaxID=66429 RepID=UPI001F1D953B|nr:methyltransferase domain-containing protein [Streptomyces roseoverticillatus]MCF3106943.1 methyltransferase domain-containing protein [Streptomyces roseoverticillatus]